MSSLKINLESEKLNKKDDILSESIIQNKTLTSLSEVKLVVNYLQRKGTPTDVIIRTLKTYEWEFSYKGITQSEIIEAIALQKSDADIIKGSFENVIIYEDEVDYLLLVEDEIVRKILFYFLVVAKWNNHPSWWVRYDRDSAFEFWGIKKSVREREKIMQNCCNNGLDLRVIGSKNSMVCFNLFFRMPVGEEAIRISNEDEIRDAYSKLFKTPRKFSVDFDLFND